jgi:polysaccharide export outer membrane protein
MTKWLEFVKNRLRSLGALALCIAAAPAFAQATEPSPADVPARVPGPDYIIGPGDTLNVFVWRNPELSVTVPVRPDGKISTPLVEDMTAVGKTPAQLGRDIEVVLAEYVKQPHVNIIVQVPASAYSQIRVVGQVTRPSPVAYREGMTVLDALLAVGGLTPFASGNRAKVVRTVDGKPHEIHVKLNDLLNKGDLSNNVELRPGDVLVVPESFF